MMAPMAALGDFFQISTLLQVLVSGLAKASLYILIALGLTIIFGLMGVLNFAHGSLTMIGAYVGGAVMVYLVTQNTSGTMRIVFFFASVLVVLGVMAVVGGALESTLIRPLYDREPMFQILLTFGLTLIIDELARIGVLFFNLRPASEWQAALGTRPAMLSSTYDVAGIQITGLAVFEIVVGILTIAAMWVFISKTRYGLIIRAASEDSVMVSGVGINYRRVFTIVFALGSALAGLAGILLMWDPLWGASVPLSFESVLPAFIVVIIGGLGTFRGTVIAGVLVGIIDAVGTWWFHNAINFSGFPEMLLFLTLVVALIVRPQGISGVEEVGGH